MTQTDPHNSTLPANAPSCLKLDHVSFGYDRDRLVLHDITGTIQPGKVCTVIGPNAAGKSTLLKLMLGQLEPRAGQVTVNGHTVHQLSPRERASSISYVPQRPAAHLTFRVEEIVAMGRFAQRESSDAIDNALIAFDIADLRTRVYGELSIGQQQRVAMARAAAQASDADPARHVILLDEPISAMDLKHVHATMRSLRDFAKRGFAIVMVLHDLNLTAMYADDVWLLDAGKLIHAGPWSEVMQPSILEPVYDVPIRETSKDASGRPVFHVIELATM